MKTFILHLITLVSGLLLVAGLQGCYTQMGSTRDEAGYSEQRRQPEAQADDQDSDQAEDQAENGEDSSAEGEYSEVPQDAGQDWNTQVHVGMDGYYPSTWWPSVGFSFAYNDPYYGWGYPSYGYGYGYPYYGYDYGYGYPYYPYYGYGYCGYYPVTAVPWQNREFGSTRTGGNTRGARTVNAGNGSRDAITAPLQQMDLPVASDRQISGGAAAGKRTSGTATAPTKPTRTKGTSRKSVTKKMEQKLSPGQKGSKSDRDQRRLYRDRGSVSGGSSDRNNGSGPSVNSSAPPSSGGASARQGTSTRPSGSSPPPSRGNGTVRSAPAPSVAPAPAPRSGGAAPSSGGSRSGGGGGGGGRRR